MIIYARGNNYYEKIINNYIIFKDNWVIINIFCFNEDENNFFTYKNSQFVMKIFFLWGHFGQIFR